MFELFNRGPWINWFAWRPVRVSNKWIWLKTIERRQLYISWPVPVCNGHFGWEYRL